MPYARSGPINVPIILGIRFTENGVLFDPFSVGDVKIYTYGTNPQLLATIAPDAYGVGIYRVTWNALATSPTLQPGLYLDEWTWIAQDGMPSKTQRFIFELTEAIDLGEEEPPPTETPLEAAHVGCRPKPSWIARMGLVRVDDVGNGTGISMAWEDARTDDPDRQIHFNLYGGNTRFELLENYPFAITTARQVVINVSKPGDVHYFAVKATEFDTSFDITELEQIGVNLYKYPAPVILLNNLPAELDGYTIYVDGDISNYPSNGELLINTEIIRYASKDAINNAFIIEANNRGITLTQLQEHFPGDTIKLWRGIEDGNSVIRQGIATWHQIQAQRDDAVGTFNSDADGYRANNLDIVTTDLSASDENTSDFPGFDFCGYHRPSLQDTFSGKCVGSYVGGEFNGFRGLNFQERDLARLDTMIQLTGEPAILLRRKWTGRRCKCFSLRREHQRTRCDRCYGTGFEGGYDRFLNPRAVSESFTNTRGFIMIRIYPHSDDLELKLDQGLTQNTSPTAWTIAYPTLKDRDVVVRFTEEFVEEFRYEIQDVTRNKLFFSQSGKQEFRMVRLDKTNVIYQFDISNP